MTKITKFKAARHDLCESEGRSWSYQADEKQFDAIYKDICDHHETWKCGVRDKQTHTIFLVYGGPGTGKSRLLDEFSIKMVDRSDGEPEVGRMLKDAFVFKLSFENGTGSLVSSDYPAHEIGCRMLYQLIGDDGDWGIFRANPRNHVNPGEVMSALCKMTNIDGTLASFVILCDSIQNLPHEPNSKDSRLYRALVCLQDLVNGSPSFVVSVTSYTSYIVDNALKSSPQRRKLICPPPVDGKQVIPNAGSNPLVEVLIEDMGGHGRALEVLFELVRNAGADHEELFSVVVDSLKQRYPAWRTMTDHLVPVLGLVLGNVRVAAETRVAGTNFCVNDVVETGLVRLSESGVLTCPYIWLSIMVPKVGQELHTSILAPLIASMDGRVHGSNIWQTFEEFNVRFRCFRSKLCGTNATLSGVHAGATISSQFPGIMNTEMSQHQASQQCPTGYDSSVEEILCEDANVQLSKCDSFILNAPGAPYGDAFGRVAANVHEVHQYKKYTKTPLSLNHFVDERNKPGAVGPNDLFGFFCTVNTSITPDQLPANSFLVDTRNYEAYYGPFAGRAFIADRRVGVPNANTSVRAHLLGVRGLGPLIVNAIMSLRAAGQRFSTADELEAALRKNCPDRKMPVSALKLLTYTEPST